MGRGAARCPLGRVGRMVGVGSGLESGAGCSRATMPQWTRRPLLGPTGSSAARWAIPTLGRSTGLQGETNDAYRNLGELHQAIATGVLLRRAGWSELPPGWRLLIDVGVFMQQPFVVKGPVSGEKLVECWAESRLPFENLRDWQKAQKEELVRALRLLEAGPNETLSAVYLSPVAGERFDAENVLFYNVGPGAFRKSATFGLVFETAVAAAVGTLNQGDPRRHYQRYEVIPGRGGFTHWKALGHRIRIAGAGSCVLKNDIKPDKFWYAVKSSGVKDFTRRLKPSAKFALAVTLRSSTPSLNLSAAIKPIFDGIISAFHRYGGSEIEQVSARLGEKLGVPSDVVATLLLDDQFAILDDRPVIHLRSHGVQWNPKDDDCVAGALYHEFDPVLSPGFRFEIEVTEVEPAFPSA